MSKYKDLWLVTDCIDTTLPDDLIGNINLYVVGIFSSKEQALEKAHQYSHENYDNGEYTHDFEPLGTVKVTKVKSNYLYHSGKKIDHINYDNEPLYDDDEW